jgi:hypothetical protein
MALLAQRRPGLDGLEAGLGVKCDATNAKLDATNAEFDAISQRLGAEFRAEIAAQTSALAKSIAAARSVAPPAWAPVQLAPAPPAQPAPVAIPGSLLPPPPRSRP